MIFFSKNLQELELIVFHTFSYNMTWNQWRLTCIFYPIPCSITLAITFSIWNYAFLFCCVICMRCIWNAGKEAEIVKMARSTFYFILSTAGVKGEMEIGHVMDLSYRALSYFNSKVLPVSAHTHILTSEQLHIMFSLSRESIHNDVSQVLTHNMFPVKSDHPYFIQQLWWQIFCTSAAFSSNCQT